MALFPRTSVRRSHWIAALLVGILLGMMFVPFTAGAQRAPKASKAPVVQTDTMNHDPANAMPWVILRDSVRQQLADVWNDHDPLQTERAYCGIIAEQITARNHIHVYWVEKVMQAVTMASTVNSTYSYCPKAPDIVLIHTHPPSSCYDTAQTQCAIGGYDAYQCEPSETDQESLERSGNAFGLIQCDRNAFVHYFPKATVAKGMGIVPDGTTVAKDSLPSLKEPAFALAMVAGAVAVKQFHIDSDKGGYTPRWGDKALFPKAYVHGLGAFALTEVGSDLGLKPWKAAMWTMVGGVGYEWAQGFTNPKDLMADAIGAGTSALWRTLRNRHK